MSFQRYIFGRPMLLTSRTLGSALRGLRKQRGLTQVSAAKTAGIARSRLAAIESGEAGNLELLTLQRLLDVYNAELHVEPRAPRRTLNQILREQEER